MDFGGSGAFKFNFTEEGAPPPEEEEGAAVEGEKVYSIPPKEVFITLEELDCGEPKDFAIHEGLTMQKVMVLDAGLVMDGIQGTDLKRGEYEGGLKLWECSIDLIKYLEKQGVAFCRGKRVLELGCGHGLPGIYAGTRGAEAVALQDYNEEVLRAVTAPNVLGNLNGCMPAEVRFIAGGWEGMAEVLGAAGFDIILTAETIYDKESQVPLYHLIKSALRPGGVALVAAKSYYFGVGGGSHTFTELVRGRGEMEIERVAEFRDGGSNVREILQMKLL